MDDDASQAWMEADGLFAGDVVGVVDVDVDVGAVLDDT